MRKSAIGIVLVDIIKKVLYTWHWQWLQCFTERELFKVLPVAPSNIVPCTS